MRRNVGKIDACIRGGFAVVFLIVAVVFNWQPILSLVAAFLSLVFAATALTHQCPFYGLFGLDTRARHTHPQHH
ncbi:MAG: DUF2892 domain-containing protein [Gemmatimonadales bacterium]|nr:DUF2892 domain-containing protein [Gemmatimonadales bacterium]NIN11040.1 DUF2892 domain-containing protein [Gemmatimonadales bacterium]NIN49637.1 DUF2892 domain-containing protein [Gemmatimonadales bacterium]NIP07101.1 DUF2892 domain-containing protein [Gemmatimonadales bacterium]NIQ99492.1 DUF2892 domain-containing protein [Gemmatimonadales bacterium]